MSSLEQKSNKVIRRMVRKRIKSQLEGIKASVDTKQIGEQMTTLGKERDELKKEIESLRKVNTELLKRLKSSKESSQ